MKLPASFSEIPDDATINMMSQADKVKGQGVGAAYVEQVQLVRDQIGHRYNIVLNQYKFETITHYHTINFRYFLHALAGKRKTNRVGYVHFIPETLEGSIKLPTWMKHIFYWYVLKFYKTMDYLVTVNPMFIDKLVALGFERDNIKYIPNFVSEEQFYPQSTQMKKDIRKTYGIDSNAFVVLGVGQIQTRKGILDFIKVAKLCPNLQFVWAGGFSFGRITDGFEELTEAIKKPPANVNFIGIVDRSDMNNIYNMSDVMFLPSYSELFPMTVLETMNVKLPLLLRSLELYEDILFNYYLKADTNENFASILKKLANDTDYYNVWSLQSEKGHDFYSKKSVGIMWEHFYDDIASYEGSQHYDSKTQTVN